MQKSFDFDVVVIGAGIAGFVASVTAAGLGKRVALVEKRKLGGNCANFTCIPSKALIRAGHANRLVTRLHELGLQTASPTTINTDGVMERVRSVIQQVYEKDLPETFEEIGMRIITGAAQFLDNHHISVDERTISAGTFIIATGTLPLVPPIPGLDKINYLTNETVFDLTTLPQSMIILGGGVDGIEFASAFGRLGVDITVVEMSNRLLPAAERDLVELLVETLRDENITIMNGTKAVSFSDSQGKVVLTVQRGNLPQENIQADTVLITIGRRLTLEELSLDKAGVEYTRRNIVTDQKLQTTAPNIYACGDVVGPYQLASMAEYQGIIAATNAILPFKKKVQYENSVFVTFTEPTLAQMGLTEEQARDKYGDRIRIYQFDYAKMRRALVDGAQKGLAKLICTRRGKLLGAHILGEGAAEVIHELQVVKALNQPLHKLYSITHAYPTYAQALVGRAGQLAYLDRMSSNLFVKVALALLPGFKNKLALSRKRLAESEEAPPKAHPVIKEVDLSVKSPGAKAPEFHLNALRIDDTACLVELPATLTDFDEEPLIMSCGHAVGGERLNLLLDFSNVQSMNGLGVSMLVKLANRIRRGGQRILACGINDHYRQVLTLTGLNQVIKLYGKRDDALTALDILPTSIPSPSKQSTAPRDEHFWCHPLDKISVPFTSPTGFNLNVNGRLPVGPVNGFGQLWQKIYWLQVNDSAITPEQAIKALKENFPALQPSYNHFYPSPQGIKAGEVVLFDSFTPGGPVSSGVLVLYADELSFTFITPQGHPESGWISFTATRGEDGKTLVQLLGLARSNDFVYETAFRLVGSKMQVRIWTSLLRSLAHHLGVPPVISVNQTCVDSGLQWSELKNLWYNAQIRTILYTPVHWARKLTKQSNK
jgi:anti-anti-sigma factor